MEAVNLSSAPSASSVVSTAESRLSADLQDGDVLVGIATGRWRIGELLDGQITVEVRIGETDDYLGLRLDVTDYPAQAPAGKMWDLVRNLPLDAQQWPTGHLAEKVFRPDWSVANGNAPYAPWDRTALVGHSEWPTAHPGQVWNGGRTIGHYLRETRRVLEDAVPPPGRSDG
jgi:hypothetical protein